MEKRKLNRITAGFIVLVVMVLILMFSNSLRRSSHITLPEEGSSPGQTEDDTNASGGDALTVIAVTPETVQTAIETLTRPRQYSRVIRVEQLWDGGSGSFETTVTVSGRWTRTDRSLSDGQVRHTITDGEITYIWYGSESSVYSAPAGDITPDDEQAIPTYETILDLPVEDIAAADYRSVSDVNCIYVETVQDPGGLHPTVLGQRGDRLTGSVGTAAGGGDHLPHGIPDGRSEHPLHRPVYPAGRHGAAGHMRRTPTGDSRRGFFSTRPRRNIPPGPFYRQYGVCQRRALRQAPPQRSQQPSQPPQPFPLRRRQERRASASQTPRAARIKTSSMAASSIPAAAPRCGRPGRPPSRQSRTGSTPHRRPSSRSPAPASLRRWRPRRGCTAG